MFDRPDPASDAPLNAPDVPAEDKGRELAGDRAPIDQAAYIAADEVAGSPDVEFNDTAQYEGYPEVDRGEGSAERVEGLADLELREGETDDPNIAAEEGLTYVPPTDPPVYPGTDDEGADVAADFGVSSLAEPYDASHHDELLTSEDEMTARVRDALRSDAAASPYADRIEIDTEGGVVTLRGEVDGVEDTDNIAAVAEVVDGVVEVRDRLRVRGL